MDIYNRLVEHEMDTRVSDDGMFFIALGGSQNYNLADENSDVDSHLFYIPSLDDIAINKYTSYEHRMPNSEHCNVKDVREYFNMFRKGNSNFVELLFTDWVVVNENYREMYDNLVKYREEIARYNEIKSLNAALGIAVNKYKHIVNNPVKNYNPKDTMNILRINYFIDAYIHQSPYKNCIYIEDEQTRLSLLEVKREHSVKDFWNDLPLVEYTINIMKNKVNDYLSTYVIDWEKTRLVDNLFIATTKELITKRIIGN